MAEIFHLSEFRDHNALRMGYRPWHLRFGQDFSRNTRLADLCPETLNQLAEPGDDSANLINALIIGFLEFGENLVFGALESRDQSRVLDIHLFLADQIRFEMMWRLGWLSTYSGNQYALFAMVRQFDEVQKACQDQPPQLAANHPGFAEYQNLVHRDQQVFIRRMLPSALKAFKDSYQL